MLDRQTVPVVAAFFALVAMAPAVVPAQDHRQPRPPDEQSGRERPTEAEERGVEERAAAFDRKIEESNRRMNRVLRSICNGC